MSIISYERNYLPVDIETKYHACLRRVESLWPIKKVLSFYHVKRQSLYRWLKVFDGSKESLYEKSHKPKSKHPKAIKQEIVDRINNLNRRNKDISYTEIWVRLRHENINISLSSVLRTLKRNNLYVSYKPHPKKHNKEYHTPDNINIKWQMDVKYVPNECKAPLLEDKYYQYTILDEHSRLRILYYTNEHSMYETVQAIKFAYSKLKVYPREIQTDNGLEFTDTQVRKNKGKYLRDYDNYLERFLSLNNIKHHLIRPRTPEHNGKVERSHRIDQDKFYKYLRFYSLEDLRYQGALWNKRYNNMPKAVLNFKTPNEVYNEKINEQRQTDDFLIYVKVNLKL